ncbi:MAG: OmpA family protein [Rubellimicrobium sp.]|nr:OmpA family protein [Rubellimicrobium sp.]
MRSVLPAAALALLAALPLGVLSGPPAHAQPAIEGAASHPMVPLPGGGYITRDEVTDFAAVTLPASPVIGRNEIEEVLTVEGEWRQMEYTLDGLETAVLRLYRGYLDHFEGEGFEIVFSGIGAELGPRDGYTFITSSDRILARTPGTGSDSNAYILARSPDGGTVIALSFFSRQNARRMIINAVQLEEMEAIDLFAIEAEPAPEPEPAPLVQQDVSELEAGLVADGRVIVNAILFEFDRADILPESAQALATVAALMAERPGLSLLVVGHTDAVGDFDYNLRLSVERAQAVTGWLADRHGIAPGRLRAAGAGPMSPVTTNRTDAGRAENRRVELVEMID